MMCRGLYRTLVICLSSLLLLGGSSVWACPFCSSVQQTLGEEMTSMEAVVFGSLVGKVGGDSATGGADDIPKATFRVLKVLKGSEFVDADKLIETIYFGEAEKGDKFLLMGVDAPNIMWSTPLRVSDAAHEYISALPKLPLEGPERLEFFQDYFENEDEMLARDAYDEFAKAPYAAVKSIKEKMDRAQLVAWIEDVNIPASRKRLYLTMLGVCGTEAELPLLEQLMQSNDRQKKAGLDAMIACYLTIKGPDGMDLIEELFLKNQDAEYADTYAAIAALRFHGSEDGDVIPRERLTKGLEFMLARPKLADLVIPDLARWEDWQVMDQLVDLFKNADDKTSWVRVPVINYLRACPLPEAKEHLKELEKIDPDAVRRANTFFPLDSGSDESTADDTKIDSSQSKEEGQSDDVNSKIEPSDDAKPAAAATGKSVSAFKVPVEDKANQFVSTKSASPIDLERTKAIAQTNSKSTKKIQPVVAQASTRRWLFTLVVPAMVCFALFVLMWGLLTGHARRLAS